MALGVALAVAVAGAMIFRRETVAPVRYTTAKADRGRVVAKVTATGTLSALVTVQVGSQVSGRVSELHADFNSVVKKGEVLARIDSQLFEAEKEQARANHAVAAANLSRAKIQAADAVRQAERSKSLFEQKLIAQAEYDTASANADGANAAVAAAAAQLQQARASLNQAEVNLQYTTIYSPINGVVISRSVELGQTVAASLQAPTLFILAEDLRKMQVDTSVAEADIGKLKDGMNAFFTVDAYPSERFTGTLRQIRNAATTVQSVVTYNAIINVENEELKLKPGMTANVTFVYANKDDVLRVPNAALRFKPSPAMLGAPAPRTPTVDRSAGPARRGRSGAGHSTGGDVDTPDKRTVWVLRNEKPTSVAIQTGTSDGTLTEVVSGDLQEGDPVITDASTGEAPAARRTGMPGMGGPSGGPGGPRRVF
ncbi:MAG: efflux RND transporter periplasmic adaptor subunit [Myxococcaceae bacterium]